MACFFNLETIGSSLDHDLMASIWEEAITILAGNSNSGHSYIITAVIMILELRENSEVQCSFIIDFNPLCNSRAVEKKSE